MFGQNKIHLHGVYRNSFTDVTLLQMFEQFIFFHPMLNFKMGNCGFIMLEFICMKLPHYSYVGFVFRGRIEMNLCVFII